jgi:hypothetical protein
MVAGVFAWRIGGKRSNDIFAVRDT